MHQPVCLTVLGCPMVIRTNDAVVRSECVGLFGSSLQPGGSEGIELTVVRKGARYECSIEGRSAELQLGEGWPRLDNLVRLLVVRQRQDLTFLHSSCVVFREKAALLVGASMSGKTTLSWALREVGCPILADDLTPVDLACGNVFPLRTKATVRPFTEILFGARWEEEGKTSCDAPPECPVQVGWVFLLDPRTGKRHHRQAVANQLAQWSRMYELCTGEKSPVARRQPPFPTKRDEHDFDTVPELRQSSKARILRLLMKYIHPPHPPLRVLLSEMAGFLSRVTCYTLVPGHLDRTVHLVLDAMSWEGG